METDFIKWYFDTHYIVSTFFTPFFSLMWGCFTDNVGRSLVSFMWFSAIVIWNIME